MLVRRDFHDILEQDVDGVIARHFMRAVRIRTKFTGIEIGDTGRLFLPTCHDVAHAYARAFEVKVEDGLCTYVSGYGAESVGSAAFPLCSQGMHSWNVIRITDETAVILDVFPDMGNSMMPALHPYPHPAYRVPTDKEFKEQILKILWDPGFDVTIELLSDAFLALDAKTARS